MMEREWGMGNGEWRAGSRTVRSLCASVRLCVCASLFTAFPPYRLTAQVPTPESFLGFRVGQDSMLASWRQIGDYFSRLAAASPRVRVDTLGPTTQGRPYLLVTISDPANLARRTELMAAQQRLADPRGLDSASEARLVRESPAVIVINCSIHSTEIGASQMSMELAWRLATDTALGRALKNVVVLLVPSANPDGIDIVGDWYRGARGTAWDGTGPPWLYHPYVGHDDNRDWYMLTQPETRMLTRVLYRQWFPEVFYDVHQQGNTGSRFTMPPFSDPVNPNIDAAVLGGINLIGSTMGQALLDAGKTGGAHQERYDMWWHGGARTAPARHNMVGLLTEAASAQLASPACLRPDQMRQPARGINYPAPWTSGCWHLRDIVDYELIASEALIHLVSDEREAFVQRFVTVGRRSIEAGRRPPYALVLPADGDGDAGRRALLVNLLIAGGVEVHRARSGFTADGRTWAPGSYVVRLDQPFRAHVKDLLERQVYPDRRAYPGGPPLPPYDVAGWSLGLQMGVAVDSLMQPLGAMDLARVDTATVSPGTLSGRGDVVLLDNRSNGQITALWRALDGGASADIAAADFTAEGRSWPAGTLIVRGGRAAIERGVREAGFDATLVRRAEAPAGSPHIAGVPRVALYKSWNASMDEGWTRWVFEQLGVSYVTVTDSAIRQGSLRSRFDVVILPSENENALVAGRRPNTAPAQYTGGLGPQGIEALRGFLADGGTVIALDEASRFAINRLGAPARALRTSRGAAEGDAAARPDPDSSSVFRFYAPGSIFEASVDRTHPIASGMPASAAIYFISSTILEAGPDARVIMSYPTGRNPLLSGYVSGPEVLSGRAALIDAPVGRGHVILFGFRPQHRGQTHGTFRALTNAILYGAAAAPARAEATGRTVTGR